MPKVTVTTVLFNSAESLPDYEAAIEDAVASGTVRIVAVDNASPDESAADFRRLLPEAELIRSPVNLGFAGGCNLAWSRVATTYWLLLNPDVLADRASIEVLVGWMDAHPGVGVASPLLRSPSGGLLPVARPHDSLWRLVVEALRLHKLVPMTLRARLLLSGRVETPETINGWVPGAALIARTDAVRAVGLLNDTLFMYGEDREWCWRMLKAGWQVGVCHDVELTHVGGRSAAKTWASDEERARREVAGHITAAEQMRGRRWARLFAFVLGLTLRLEARDRRCESAVSGERELRGRLYMQAAREAAGQ